VSDRRSAISTAAGFSIAQTCVVSLAMFTGASQFALVGVVGTGGAGSAGVATSVLMGTRTASGSRRSSA
jgi:predicted branched-subunit amino acid permease